MHYFSLPPLVQWQQWKKAPDTKQAAVEDEAVAVLILAHKKKKDATSVSGIPPESRREGTEPLLLWLREVEARTRWKKI